MQDNDLIRLFRDIILDDLITLNFYGVNVVQAYQPTQQGAHSEACVYFYKVGDKRAGHPERANFYNEETDVITHKESQWIETTFQFQAFVIQNPTITNSFTASDLINTVAIILQSDNTIDRLINSDVGIYKITDLQNPFFIDDKDRYEYSPYFQAVFTHKRILENEVQKITEVKTGIYGV